MIRTGNARGTGIAIGDTNHGVVIVENARDPGPRSGVIENGVIHQKRGAARDEENHRSTGMYHHLVLSILHHFRYEISNNSTKIKSEFWRYFLKFWKLKYCNFCSILRINRFTRLCAEAFCWKFYYCLKRCLSIIH